MARRDELRPAPGLVNSSSCLNASSRGYVLDRRGRFAENKEGEQLPRGLALLMSQDYGPVSGHVLTPRGYIKTLPGTWTDSFSVHEDPRKGGPNFLYNNGDLILAINRACLEFTVVSERRKCERLWTHTSDFILYRSSLRSVFSVDK